MFITKPYLPKESQLQLSEETCEAHIKVIDTYLKNTSSVNPEDLNKVILVINDVALMGGNTKDVTLFHKLSDNDKKAFMKHIRFFIEKELMLM